MALAFSQAGSGGPKAAPSESLPAKRRKVKIIQLSLVMYWSACGLKIIRKFNQKMINFSYTETQRHRG